MKLVAQIGLIIIFSLTIVFHLLVLIKIIRYKIVWGGRLKTDADMYKFEIVSLTVNAVFLFVVLLKSNYLTIHLNENILNITLWVMVAVFILNSIGNLFSKNNLEQRIFTPITIILTVFTMVLAIDN